MRAACAQGGGAAAARAAWGASRLRGGPASCAALMPLVHAVFRRPLLSRSVARRAPCSLIACLPPLFARVVRPALGGRPVPRAPLPAPGCSVREGSAAPPRAKRSAKMAENDDLTTRWGRFRQTEGRGELCDTRCESRDLGFCSPAFLTSARPCRQVVVFGHFSTRDYVRARRRARCGGRAARERRGAWRSAGRGRVAPILAAWRSRRERVLVPFSSQAFYLVELKNDTAGIRRKDTQRLTTATRREGMITPTISNDGGCAKAPRRR